MGSHGIGALILLRLCTVHLVLSWDEWRRWLQYVLRLTFCFLVCLCSREYRASTWHAPHMVVIASCCYVLLDRNIVACKFLAVISQHISYVLHLMFYARTGWIHFYWLKFQSVIGNWSGRSKETFLFWEEFQDNLYSWLEENLNDVLIQANTFDKSP